MHEISRFLFSDDDQSLYDLTFIAIWHVDPYIAKSIMRIVSLANWCVLLRVHCVIIIFFFINGSCQGHFIEVIVVLSIVILT